MGAFMMNGLIPGPFLFVEHSEFVWAVIASLYIGNAIPLILNLHSYPTVGLDPEGALLHPVRPDPRLLRGRLLQPGKRTFDIG